MLFKLDAPTPTAHSKYIVGTLCSVFLFTALVINQQVLQHKNSVLWENQLRAVDSQPSAIMAAKCSYEILTRGDPAYGLSDPFFSSFTSTKELLQPFILFTQQQKSFIHIHHPHFKNLIHILYMHLFINLSLEFLPGEETRNDLRSNHAQGDNLEVS